MEEAFQLPRYDLERLDQVLHPLERFQEKPEQLDVNLSGIVQVLNIVLQEHREDKNKFTIACHILYILCKIRGYAVIVKLLPNSVDLLPQVVKLLPCASDLPWQAQYIVILWLSILVLAPFDLESIENGIAKSIYTFCVTQGIPQASKVRDASCLLLARLLLRTDVRAEYVPRFEQYLNENVSQSNHLGSVQTLVYIYKLGGGPIGMNRTVLKILAQTSDGFTAQKMHTKLHARYAEHLLASGEIGEAFEESVDFLLQMVRHPSTGVRYTAAKGVARITRDLPQSTVETITMALVDMYSEDMIDEDVSMCSESTWHGVSLTLAQLFRHSPISSSLGSEISQWMIRALKFEYLQGSRVVGGVVRDAAAYVVWSMMRTCSSAELKTDIERLREALLVVALFDREVSERRAAAAAFQEGVGRHGDLFPDGIAMMQLVNYFNVGSLVDTYSKLALEASFFTPYRSAIIHDLVHYRLDHWDQKLRQLAAESLAKILNTGEALDVGKDLLERLSSTAIEKTHGALLGLSELVRLKPSPELAKLLAPLKKLFTRLNSFVWKSAQRHLIYHAICLFFTHASKVLPVDDEDIAFFVTIIEHCLMTKDLTLAAVDALKALQPKADTHLASFALRAKHSPTVNLTLLMMGFNLTTATEGSQVISTLLGLADSSDTHPLTRAAAIESLAEAARQGYQSEDFINSIQFGLEDYSVDVQGDIGSYVRMAAMIAACEITLDVSFDSILKPMVRQLLEKSDRVREVSFRCLHVILRERPDPAMEDALTNM